MFVTADDGTRLYAVGTPAAVPLVFSNSLGTDHTLFDAQAAIQQERAVWRYDTRGHGQSEVPAGEYTIERLGKDLLSVIDATTAAQVDLCGVSIGGLTALWVAVHAPNRVRRLILANTAARIGNEAMWNDRNRMVRTEGMKPLAQATMARWFTEGFRAAHPDLVARFRSTIERTSPEGYLGCCAALRDADLREATRTVACPTLVVTGRHDPATPAADGQWLASQVRGARVVEFDSAHLSNVECADGFTAALREFLNEGDHTAGVRHG